MRTANCASTAPRVLHHVDIAMRVALASVLLVQFGVSFDPFCGAAMLNRVRYRCEALFA
jgi:hypothetical protein